MKSNGDLEKFYLELAMYQDQLLQSYRLIFIASQTILISIAMLLISSNNPLANIFFPYVSLFIIGLILFIIWRNITESRELDVSYCHMQLLKIERKEIIQDEKEKPFDFFKNWQNNSHSGKICILNKYKQCLLSSFTRKWMKWLPWCYLIIWVVGFIILIYFFYNI